MYSLINKIKRNKVKINNEKTKPVIEKTINKIKKNKVEIEQPLVIVSYDPNDTTLYI